MDELLLDRETLGKFVDGLMNMKAIEVSDVGELDAMREKCMKEVDEKVTAAVLGGLNIEQQMKLNELLDNPETSAEKFAEFFENAGVDLEKTVAGAMEAYGKEFLGGQNE